MGRANMTSTAGMAPDPMKQEAPPAAAPAAEEAAELDGGVDTSGMEAAADDAEIDIGTLVGDMRDAMMEVFKHRPKPWSQMLGGEQADVAKAIEYAAKKVVHKAVLALAADNRPSVRALFQGFGAKGDLTGTLKFIDVKDDDVLALFHAQKKEVLLIVADAQAYMGQRRAADIQQDDPELQFADEGDGKPAEEAAHHGVYDSAEEVWLNADEDTWEPSVQDAGRWTEARAATLAEEHEAEVKEIGPAAEAPAEA